jgi:DNA-binding response OmpR family regulator
LQAAEFDPPDLVIGDVVIPQLSGFDLAIQVRQGCSSCKVIWFSGLASLVGSVRERGYDFEVLEKPVHRTARFPKPEL